MSKEERYSRGFPESSKGAFFVFMGWDCVRIYAMYFWWDIFTLFWFTMAYCMVVSIWE